MGNGRGQAEAADKQTWQQYRTQNDDLCEIHPQDIILGVNADSICLGRKYHVVAFIDKDAPYRSYLSC
jgi:hypothetical protein